MRTGNPSRTLAAAALLAALVAPAARGADPAPAVAGRPPELAGARVARALFTTAVVAREPVDEVLALDTRDSQVLFFTDLRGLQGRTVVHRWKHGGRVMAEVPFRVGGPRWRVYSRKRLGPDGVGRWSVVVVDRATGWPLAAAVMEYRERAPDGSSRVVIPPRPAGTPAAPAQPAGADAAVSSSTGPGAGGDAPAAPPARGSGTAPAASPAPPGDASRPAPTAPPPADASDPSGSPS